MASLAAGAADAARTATLATEDDPSVAVPDYPAIQTLLRRLAAGSSGHGATPFWERPLADFLATEIEGEALIAPERETTCCGVLLPAIPGSRARRSALVKGLRGEAPFDGRRLPRIPFGGLAATAADIALVESWIEAGCPGPVLKTLPVDGTVETLGKVEIAGLPGPVFDVLADAGSYVYEKGELRQRMDIDCMSPGQLERLRFAFREMYALNRWPEDARSYNNMALIHQNHCQHGWERFLPWHRVYLYEFEQVMQQFCPDVTMPYWDFSADPYGPLPGGKGAWPVPGRKAIPDSLAALLRRSGIAVLTARGVPGADKLGGLVDVPYATQTAFFAAVQAALGLDDAAFQAYMGLWRNAYIDVLLEGNSLWYPLRYPGQFGPGTINSQIHYHYPSPDDIAQIMSLRTYRDFGGGSLYNDSFGFLDQNPHNTMHIWTGGMNPDAGKAAPMDDRNRAVQVAGRRFHKRDDLYSQPAVGDMFSNLTASYDPVFWPIHANIDRLWWEWQVEHPHSLPADLDAVLTPWAYTTRDTLDMYRFGYEYVKQTYVVPVGNAAPVGRFVSKPIDVPGSVRKRFGKAEVRLHRVPQLNRSCFIRVYLNVPDATAETGTDVAGYAGYAAVFGHGSCIGGPGHCEVPPPRTTGRTRSMNQPRNHRIDVTACARRLIADGAKQISITLVVIGADYQEDRELLRLDGVSLNFLD